MFVVYRPSFLDGEVLSLRLAAECNGWQIEYVDNMETIELISVTVEL
jgi:hypothetical protein